MRTSILLVSAAIALFPACGGGGGGGAATASDNADLASLVVSLGTLSPVFDTGTTSYDAGLVLGETVSVTCVTADAGATLTVDGRAATSGAASDVDLPIGVATVAVVVTAADGVTIRAYEVRFDRTSAALADLRFSIDRLVPAFDPDTTAYVLGPAIAPGAISMTPTAADPVATVAFSGRTIDPGDAVGNIRTDPNTMRPLELTATARDGTERTYTVVWDRSIGGQEAYLKASNAEAGDLFGTSVALDGDTLVVGAYREDSECGTRSFPTEFVRAIPGASGSTGASD